MRIGSTIICEKAKDGGPESKVVGFWLFRCKWLFTIALLNFARGSREVYHSHAFNAWSWLLRGRLVEHTYRGQYEVYEPSLKLISTPRDRIHKVYGSFDSNWVLTFRGPWAHSWLEIEEAEPADKLTILTHDRRVLGTGTVERV